MSNPLLPKMNTKSLAFLILSFLISFKMAAQSIGVAINTTAAAADPSAILDLTNNVSRGLLLPQIASTASIASPAKGLIVYQTGGTPGIYCNIGNTTTPNWILLGSGSITGSATAGQVSFWTGATTLGGNAGFLFNSATNRLSFGTTGVLQFGTASASTPAAGDVKYSTTNTGSNATPDWQGYTSSTAITSLNPKLYLNFTGANNTSYNNSSTTFANIAGQSFTANQPGSYIVTIVVGHPKTVSSSGMIFRLFGTAAVDGPFFAQFPDPDNSDFGGTVTVTLVYNKTTATSESISIQWAASSSGESFAGTLSSSSASTLKITCIRYPL